MMHEREKSDPAIGAGKPTNKAEAASSADAAELVEQRAGAKGNANEQSTHRTQGRERVSQALERVRQAARLRKESCLCPSRPDMLLSHTWNVLRCLHCVEEERRCCELLLQPAPAQCIGLTRGGLVRVEINNFGAVGVFQQLFVRAGFASGNKALDCVNCCAPV